MQYRIFICVLTALSFLPVTSGLAQIAWSDPVTIGWANNPDLAIDRQKGRIHVVGLNQGVRYAILDSVGNLITEYGIQGTGSNNGRMDFGLSIDLDSQGYPHIVFKDNRTKKYFDAFYIRADSSGWRPRVTIAANVWRGYVVRVAVDGSDRVHMAHGRADFDFEPNGYVNTYRAISGVITKFAEDLVPYRADDRLEIDAEADGTIHLVLPRGGLLVPAGLPGQAALRDVLLVGRSRFEPG